MYLTFLLFVFNYISFAFSVKITSCKREQKVKDVLSHHFYFASFALLNSKPIELLEGAISSAVRRSPWQPSHSPPPGTCQHNTERELPVCGIDTYPKVWEGGREKQASRANSSKSTWQCPCRPPWTPPPDPGEMAALA